MATVNTKVWLLISLVTLAAVLRGAFLWFNSENLLDDRDAYLAIANEIADGNGYLHPATREPTAYRPPLYPLILAMILYLGGNDGAIALFHLVLGSATVALTLSIAAKLELGWAGYFAAALVAVDPLLLQYATLPMTETLGTFLITLLLLLFAVATERLITGRVRPSGEPEQQINGRTSHTGYKATAILTGLILGISALCRPTAWAFVTLMVIYWTYLRVRAEGATSNRVRRLGFVWMTAIAALVTVSPWLIRNTIIFKSPILTTTHGGYTLLLGNNPVFYREVVAKPWGTVWDDADATSNQTAWYQSMQQSMANDLAEDAGELQRDQWMYRQARRNIKDQPGVFVQACCLRVLRFWNLVPIGSAAASIPRVALYGIFSFYLFVFVGLILGLYWMIVSRSMVWIPIVLLILGTTLVHVFYWSNMRMRAPLVPAIALVAAYGWSECRGPGKLRKPRGRIA